jgi:hypothetical protein
MAAMDGIDMPSVSKWRLLHLIKMPLIPTEWLTQSIEIGSQSK